MGAPPGGKIGAPLWHGCAGLGCVVPECEADCAADGASFAAPQSKREVSVGCVVRVNEGVGLKETKQNITAGVRLHGTYPFVE